MYNKPIVCYRKDDTLFNRIVLGVASNTIKDNEIWFEGKAYRMGHAETMRGCPFHCSYCGSGSIKKSYADNGEPGYIRYKDPEQVVDECEMLKNKYNLEMFYFTVGTFTALPIKILERLADLYSKRVGLPFIALVHPNTINKKVAGLLKKMGCVHTSIGVESGVREFRRRWAHCHGKKQYARYNYSDEHPTNYRSYLFSNVRINDIGADEIVGCQAYHGKAKQKQD